VNPLIKWICGARELRGGVTSWLAAGPPTVGGRPRGELLGYLTGMFTWVPAGEVSGLIRRLTAAAEGYRCAEQRW